MADRSDIEFAEQQLKDAIVNGDLTRAQEWAVELEKLKFEAVIEGNPAGPSREEWREAFERFKREF